MDGMFYAEATANPWRRRGPPPSLTATANGARRTGRPLVHQLLRILTHTYAKSLLTGSLSLSLSVYPLSRTQQQQQRLNHALPGEKSTTHCRFPEGWEHPPLRDDCCASGGYSRAVSSPQIARITSAILLGTLLTLPSFTTLVPNRSRKDITSYIKT